MWLISPSSLGIRDWGENRAKLCPFTPQVPWMWQSPQLSELGGTLTGHPTQFTPCPKTTSPGPRRAVTKKPAFVKCSMSKTIFPSISHLASHSYKGNRKGNRAVSLFWYVWKVRLRQREWRVHGHNTSHWQRLGLQSGLSSHRSSRHAYCLPDASCSVCPSKIRELSEWRGSSTQEVPSSVLRHPEIWPHASQVFISIPTRASGRTGPVRRPANRPWRPRHSLAPSTNYPRAQGALSQLRFNTLYIEKKNISEVALEWLFLHANLMWFIVMFSWCFEFLEQPPGVGPTHTPKGDAELWR